MAKLSEVTSYSHPPAKEQVSPDVLSETVRAFVSSEVVLANNSSVLSVFKNDKFGIDASTEIGTPSVNTAVTLVSLTTVTVSA